MNALVLIPARGGSKGIPRKNIKLLGGKPLIQYTIEAAKEIFNNENICVSTDDFEIKKIVENLGLDVPFIRPYELSKDESGTHEVIMHAVNYYENKGLIFNTIILLQPTSPFRNSSHIKEAIELYDDKCQMVVSVKKTNSNPYYVLMEEDINGWLVKSKKGNYTRRQDCPDVYEINGAIYIINIKELRKNDLSKLHKVKKYIMDEYCSHDIDTAFDWEIANQLANHLK